MAPKPIDWTEPFLAALRQLPVLGHAAQAAGIHRVTAWQRMRSDPDFAVAVEQAMEAGVDRAEQEAFRRGVTGYEEPVVYQGQITYHVKRDAHGNPLVTESGAPALLLDENNQPIPVTVRKHSDALLNTILKGRRKSVYAERVEQTGAGGGPIQQQQVIIATGVPADTLDINDIV